MDAILPAIPPVRPRVVYDGDDRPLDEVVEELLADGACGVVELSGESGSGKTTALSLLAARFGDSAKLQLVDNPTDDELQSLSVNHLCVIGSTMRLKRPDLRLPLAPWGADQMIEYLLDVCPAACGSVMSRLGPAASRGWSTYMATILLDRFIANPMACNPQFELYEHVKEQLDLQQLEAAQELCLTLLIPTRGRRALDAMTAWRDRKIAAKVRFSLLALSSVTPHLAADALLAALTSKSGVLPESLPHDLLEVAAPRCRETPGVLDYLRQAIDDPVERASHPAIASLLAAADRAWSPAPTTDLRRHFHSAQFRQVEWPKIDLRGADLRNADFSNAQLKFARLSGAELPRANFYGANLQAADLMHANGLQAIFNAANLSQANLTDAKFISGEFVAANLRDAELFRVNLRDAHLIAATLAGANLASSILTQAKLQDADFTGANLRSANLYGVDLRTALLAGANMENANLAAANLEDVRFADANLRGAKLTSAHLTGSSMPRAHLYGADLGNANLAEIDWENADLRNADLRGATFHMGSSRSGLVNSPIALEGNMTGFYNDDYEDRVFKRPEEIRKANLRGADLCGAKLGNVNFYLVDLRDAKLDPDALRHARNCGAILDDVAAA